MNYIVISEAPLPEPPVPVAPVPVDEQSEVELEEVAG